MATMAGEMGLPGSTKATLLGVRLSNQPEIPDATMTDVFQLHARLWAAESCCPGIFAK